MTKQAASPTHRIVHIELEELEKAIYSRDHNLAGVELLRAMKQIRIGGEFAYKRGTAETISACYTRLAAAIASYICDASYIPSDDAYRALCLEAPTFESIFKATPMNGSEHLARVLADNPTERDPSKLDWSSMPALAKWFIFCGLDSNIGTNYEEVFSKAAKTMFPLWVGLLASPIVYTALAMERKNALLKMGKYFVDLEVPDELLSPLADVFMYCSYSTAPDRHEVKRDIMRMMSNAIKKRAGGIPEVTRHRGKGKPTILIPVEWFGSFHAMHRCYAPVIEQLRSGFRLVACARASMLDENARGYFDGLLPIPEGNVDLSVLMAKIKELSPDIIFYPSVGMALWWVALASIRLAPIQIMSVGHPASSYSEVMDYIITDEEAIEPRCFTEKPVMLPPGLAFHFVERPDYGAVERIPSANPELVRIAIPASTMKLNHHFFDSLTRIEVRAREMGRKVEYHFFAGLIGVGVRHGGSTLQKMFEGCAVHPRLTGPEYLKRLGACDFSLAPFPFGGTNSTIDALLLDQPVVALWGEQPHERFDALMLQKIGAGALVATTVDEYEDICLRLCKQSERDEWSKKIREADCSKAFYSPLPSLGWLKAFRHIYDYHEEIQQSQDAVHWRDFMKGE